MDRDEKMKRCPKSRFMTKLTNFRMFKIKRNNS